MALYKYALSLVAPAVDTGLPAPEAEQSGDAEAESIAALPARLAGDQVGDLSVPTWARLLKNARLRQDGVAFRLIVRRCITWCERAGKAQLKAGDSATHQQRDTGCQIPIDEEAVQTLPQLLQLVGNLTATLRASRVNSLWYKPPLQGLQQLVRSAAQSDPTSSSSSSQQPSAIPISEDLGDLDPYAISALARYMAPPSVSSEQQSQAHATEYNWNTGAGALRKLDTPSEAAQVQCHELMALCRDCSDDELDWPSVLRRYRTAKNLRWQPGRYGLDADKHDKTKAEYFDPFPFLGSPEDPFSACYVIIQRERLLRWAKEKHRIATATDRGAALHPALSVPTWLFATTLRVLAETGQTDTIRGLIRTYLQSQPRPEQNDEPRSHPTETTSHPTDPTFHPTVSMWMPMTNPDDPIPGSFLLNALVRSHAARNRREESDAEFLGSVWKDVSDFCLPGEQNEGVPLLSPTEETVCVMLDLLPANRAAVGKAFRIVRKMEAHFGARPLPGVPERGWGRSPSSTTAAKSKPLDFIDHPALTNDNPDTSKRDWTRPSMILFTIATARRLLARAQRMGSAKFCKGALLLARRWAAEEKERSIMRKAEDLTRNARKWKRRRIRREWVISLRKWERYASRGGGGRRQDGVQREDDDKSSSMAPPLPLRSYEAWRAAELGYASEDAEDAEPEDANEDKVALEDTASLRLKEFALSLSLDLSEDEWTKLIAERLRKDPSAVYIRMSRSLSRELGLWHSALRVAWKKGLLEPYPEPPELREVEARLLSYGDSPETQQYLQRRLWVKDAPKRAAKKMMRQVGASQR